MYRAQVPSAMTRKATSRGTLLLRETHNMLKFGSSPFASDPSGQLNVLGHDGHPLGVDSLQAEFKKQVFSLEQGTRYLRKGWCPQTGRQDRLRWLLAVP